MGAHMDIAIFIMAAGQGTRFKLDVHKQAVSIGGKQALARLLERVKRLDLQTYVLLHDSQPQSVKEISSRVGIETVWQPTQNGTGGALESFVSYLQDSNKLPEYLFVVNGDMPCVRESTLRNLLAVFQKNPNMIQMVAATFPFETGFGRVFQKEDFVDIRESRDCSSEDLASEDREGGLVNTGVYWFPVAALMKVIHDLPVQKHKNEKYITDLFSDTFVKRSGTCARVIHQKEWRDFLGMNTTEDLKKAESIIQDQIHEKLAQGGVHFKGRGYIEETVQIGKGSIIYPGVTLTGNTRIGECVTVETNATLHNTTIGNNSLIKAGSYIEDSHVGESCKIGPHAHLRSNTRVGNTCRVGNFVEMKNVQFGDGSKAAHLAYVGDATVGKNVNISCGVITCNYDGKNKSKTIIEDDVFVGSDVQLIAPITIGKGSYIASGSTINKSMAQGDFAIARARQTTKPGQASRFRQKKS